MSINWTNLFNKYKGLWVALKDDEITVVATGKTAKEALERAKSKGEKAPILTRMPDKAVSYVGLV